MATSSKRIHFIAIGGSVMHQLAIAMQQSGYIVSGSDDEIFDPAKSNLEKAGLLPEKYGWDPDKIAGDMNCVVLGMHAHENNPELLKAQSLEIPIYSFPSFIYQHSLDKQRIVITGSHGKTTITAMVMHVLKYCKKNFDYVIGAQLEGFDLSVKLTDAPIIIIEGDEYTSSILDKTPKILNYHHHIGLVNGIAWDHVNIYETVDEYVRQFDVFAESTPKGGSLIFYDEDPMATVICGRERTDVQTFNYTMHPYEIIDGKTILTHEGKQYLLNIFGKHNMINISAAKTLLSRIGVQEEQFYEAITSFKGANKRLELISNNHNVAVYRDYAHAPSKVKASVEAIKELYPDRKLIACLELHTYSSLNKEFLSEYKGSFDFADSAIIYYNPKAVELKKLDPITKADIRNSFEKDNLEIFDNSDIMFKHLEEQHWDSKNLLLMSSGNFNNIDLKELSKSVTRHHT